VVTVVGEVVLIVPRYGVIATGIGTVLIARGAGVAGNLRGVTVVFYRISARPVVVVIVINAVITIVEHGKFVGTSAMIIFTRNLGVVVVYGLITRPIVVVIVIDGVMVVVERGEDVRVAIVGRIIVEGAPMTKFQVIVVLVG
jgi:hypothetical protein